MGLEPKVIFIWQNFIGREIRYCMQAQFLALKIWSESKHGFNLSMILLRLLMKNTLTIFCFKLYLSETLVCIYSFHFLPPCSVLMAACLAGIFTAWRWRQSDKVCNNRQQQPMCISSDSYISKIWQPCSLQNSYKHGSVFFSPVLGRERFLANFENQFKFCFPTSFNSYVKHRRSACRSICVQQGPFLVHTHRYTSK